MRWKRRRDRWRKLPRSRSRRKNAMHGGPYSRIPGTPPGSEIDMSTSGRVATTRPWYRSKWILFLPAGGMAWLVFWPMLLEGGTWVLGCGLLAWLTYRTWRP